MFPSFLWSNRYFFGQVGGWPAGWEEKPTLKLNSAQLSWSLGLAELGNKVKTVNSMICRLTLYKNDYIWVLLENQLDLESMLILVSLSILMIHPYLLSEICCKTLNRFLMKNLAMFTLNWLFCHTICSMHNVKSQISLFLLYLDEYWSCSWAVSNCPYFYS